MTPLTNTMGFINDDSCKVLPAIKLFQNSNQSLVFVNHLRRDVQQLDMIIRPEA